MDIRQELRDIKRHFLLGAVLYVFLVLFVCFFGVSVASYGGHTFPVIKSGSPSLASRFFVIAQKDLLPKGVALISTSPIAVFLVQIKIGLLGAFVLLFPYLIYCLLRYLSPALLHHERVKLFALSVSAALLFLLGMVFSYAFLVESMFKVLFSFNTDLNVEPLLAIDEFMSWTLASLFITGSLFLLPLFMYLLTVFRITKSSFWAKKWREIFLAFLIISSILTPDVSGVSVLLLSAPMIVLYTFGLIISAYHERKRKQKFSRDEGSSS